MTKNEIAVLNRLFQTAHTEDVLAWAWERFGARAAIGTSFQGAGLVIMHLAKEHGLKFPVFTLDTGLLFPETIEFKKRSEEFFGYEIESCTPDLTVEQQTQAHGPALWERDPDLCCTLRKVLPLQDKLSEMDCWITGLRRRQSESRAGLDIMEVYVLEGGGGRDIFKLNPMANWSRDAVWEHLRKHRIPYNPLHDQGYRSIGCWPCTRKTADGENERAGRWTGFDKVECGIHTFMAKKADFQI
jgi:phosphoadenosine phosphosulfate reductase